MLWSTHIKNRHTHSQSSSSSRSSTKAALETKIKIIFYIRLSSERHTLGFTTHKINQRNKNQKKQNQPRMREPKVRVVDIYRSLYTESIFKATRIRENDVKKATDAQSERVWTVAQRNECKASLIADEKWRKSRRTRTATTTF